jgi:hypothetical protein
LVLEKLSTIAMLKENIRDLELKDSNNGNLINIIKNENDEIRNSKDKI